MTQTATRPAAPETPVKETLFRAGRADVDASMLQVDREGGRFGAGLIKGVSLIAVGEALGHELWIDEVTLSQVAEFAKASNEAGVKCRFTHPGMSSDGMGRLLGRIHDVQVSDDRATGDLHLAKLSHDTPEGDLGEYVASLCEEDARAAGLSIVFHHDFAAEEQFMLEHQVEHSHENHRGDIVTGMRFQSPDPNNVHNYPHVRLSELNAADVVDDPAANPDGMFDRQGLPREVTEFLSYAAGLSDTKPKTTSFGIDPDRASQFLGRFLESNGLSISPKEPTVATEKSEPTVAPTREDFAAELNKFNAKFGAENGSKWFTEGKSFAEALELHCEALSAELTAEKEARTEAEEKLSSLQLGELDPVETGATDSDSKKEKKTFAQHTKGQKS
ncbi:hypothetical protein RMSM_03989 [Rhodopirellula maiorica SM1]|uniref:Uncharacterized protein n=2 Tax=Novipirellula TaxID=2795426 RepID=M5RIF2_9BACT|nr:hypothetical protein RMSM_03989 [Rhodopirellula maiorica SM1]